MRRNVFGAGLILFAGLLGACGGGYNYGYVRYGPPAPRYGVVGYAPGPGYVWTDGYWGWRGGRYVWVPGRWLRPPHARAVWVPGAWSRDGHGWRFQEGYWR